MAVTSDPALFVFWPCNEGSGSTITSQGQYAIPLTLTGSDPWGVADWVTFDSTNYFDVAMSALSSAQRNFLSPKDGLYLVWFQQFLPSGSDYSGVVSNQMSPVSIGDNSGANGLVRARVDLPGSGLFRARVRDGSTFIDPSAAENTPRYDSEDVVFILIDNRSPQKMGYFFRNRYMANGSSSVEGLGSIDFTGAADERLRVGASTNTGGDVNFPAVGQYRNIGIMPLGNDVPRGFTNWQQDMAQNDGVPVSLR